MSSALPVVRSVLIVIAAVSCSSCFVRHRTVPAPAGAAANRPLLTATKDELIARVHRVYDPIQSFNLRADMSPSVGAIYGGELTDYATIRAYVLFERPDDIRVIGFDPVVHTKTIFDMVSSGPTFRLSIPVKSAFYIGDNNAPPHSKNKLENLRPTAFLTSLIVQPPGSADQTVMEDDTDESKAAYILFMLHERQGQLSIARAVFFDRYTLEIARQKTFDDGGEIVSETRYSDWRDFDGIRFPAMLVIRRPKDGYEVTVTVITAKFNSPDVTAQQFVLEQPAGAKVTEIR